MQAATVGKLIWINTLDLNYLEAVATPRLLDKPDETLISLDLFE